MSKAAKISFKKGVEVTRVHRQVLFIIAVAAVVYHEHDQEVVTVTSISDGKHMRGSLHYKGKAVDLRIWGLSVRDVASICEDLRERLGPDYDVVQHSTHIHVEHDPK